MDGKRDFRRVFGDSELQFSRIRSRGVSGFVKFVEAALPIVYVKGTICPCNGSRFE